MHQIVVYIRFRGRFHVRLLRQSTTDDDELPHSTEITNPAVNFIGSRRRVPSLLERAPGDLRPFINPRNFEHISTNQCRPHVNKLRFRPLIFSTAYINYTITELSGFDRVKDRFTYIYIYPQTI